MNPEDFLNLNIELRLLFLPKIESRPFSDRDLELIEIYGGAVGFAREHLMGLKNVILNEGYLKQGHINLSDVETKIVRAAVNIDDCVVGLAVFKRILEGKLEWGDRTPVVRLDYENGKSDYVRADKSGLYIPSLRWPDKNFVLGQAFDREDVRI